MSKSRGNVVNPNDIIEEFGADTLRTYIMFIGDYEKYAIWNASSVKGCRRFLDRTWKLQDMLTDEEGYTNKHMTLMHKTIKKVSEDYEAMKYNTAIAAMMSFVNEITNDGSISKDELKSFLMLLNPVAPHITEEIWQEQGFGGMLNQAEWPKWDEEKTVDDVIELPVQVSGKVRGKISVSKDASLEEARKLAMHDENISKHIEGKTTVKEIYVPGKIFNIVVK